MSGCCGTASFMKENGCKVGPCSMSAICCSPSACSRVSRMSLRRASPCLSVMGIRSLSGDTVRDYSPSLASGEMVHLHQPPLLPQLYGGVPQFSEI